MEKNQKKRSEPLRFRSWKIYTVMRLTLLWNVFFVLFSFGNGFSQKKITMDLGETTIKEALVEFQRQTNKIVIYSDEHLVKDQRVFLNCKDMELEECLKSILKGSGMTYRFEDDYILIVPLKVSEQDSTKIVSKVCYFRYRERYRRAASSGSNGTIERNEIGNLNQHKG